MAIFDIEKDDLLRLSDEALEELVARLAEAEIATKGFSPACVNRSGSINAPDGGVDVRVKVPVERFDTGFLKRPDTILQVKKHRMPAAKIREEIRKEGTLLPVLHELPLGKGSYIIVSSADDCAPTKQKERVSAMKNMMDSRSEGHRIHLDFYDRSKLVQWLRQHPAVLIWVKGKLGQDISGWEPFGKWSRPPQDAKDDFILEPGLKVSFPDCRNEELDTLGAIEKMRDLVKTTDKSIRIVGLSGIGKTRFVQALFEEGLGSNSLDPSIAIYADMGKDLVPPPSTLLNRPLSEGRPAILILDNCAPALHSTLAKQLSAERSNIKLVTVEYDVREDGPETTEVIKVRISDHKMVERLLQSRFPSLVTRNAEKLAAFADGNARLSLAVAERVKEDKNLASLTSEDLMTRLFEQRNALNDDLRRHAGVMSLVYSFSVEEEGNFEELGVLSSFCGDDSESLYRSTETLLERQIVQQRGKWRAVLPHVIANRLAAAELRYIPLSKLKSTFEAEGRQRLLTSFARRLGLMHNHPVAQKIVESWLVPDGLLGRNKRLSDDLLTVLDLIGPIAPKAVFDRIEVEVLEPNYPGWIADIFSRREIILNLLQKLAYDEQLFEKSAELFIKLAISERADAPINPVRKRLLRFFQPALSGTHATLQQRLAMVNRCLEMPDSRTSSLGVEMLSLALSSPPWYGSNLTDFGAHPRDYGSHLNREDFIAWRNAFIDIAVRYGNCDETGLRRSVRSSFARVFQPLWREQLIRTELLEAVRNLHAFEAWGEGWKAVHSTIHINYLIKVEEGDEKASKSVPAELLELEKNIRPSGLVSEVVVCVFSSGFTHWALGLEDGSIGSASSSNAVEKGRAEAFRLGEKFAYCNYGIDDLGDNLFSGARMPLRSEFGKGLAKHKARRPDIWNQLVEKFENQPDTCKDASLLKGFLAGIEEDDTELADELLNQCAVHPELKHHLIELHPRWVFSEQDFRRCLPLLDDPKISPSKFVDFLYQTRRADLPSDLILEFAQKLLLIKGGDSVVLEGLSPSPRDDEDLDGDLINELNSLRLKAATSKVKRGLRELDANENYHLKVAVMKALRSNINEVEKIEWLDAIFVANDENFGCLPLDGDFIDATAKSLPEAFLDRVLAGEEYQYDMRLKLLRKKHLSEPVLAGVDVDRLIRWCREKIALTAWQAVATGIKIWQHREDEDRLSLSDSAIALLDACEEPEIILDAFYESVCPSVYGGDEFVNMRQKAEAFETLFKHRCERVATRAKLLYAKLIQRIKFDEEGLQNAFKAQEQGFE